MPPATPAYAAARPHPTISATTPMKIAPAKPAKVPIHVTAPDVPAGTTFPVVMSLGEWLASVPISVAQVSAVAAAMAPAPSGNQIHDG